MIGFPLAAVVLVAGFAIAPLRREVPRREQKPLRETFAYRWSRLIQRHPWPAALGGALLLIVLALPVFSQRLGFSDAGHFAESPTPRQAYALPSPGFAPGFHGPFFPAARVSRPDDPALLER